MNSFLSSPLVRSGNRLELVRLEPFSGAKSPTHSIRIERSNPGSGGSVAMFIAEAWNRLGIARRRASTLVDLLLVLAGSTATPVRNAVPRPVWREALDIRPWLCDALSVGGILRELSPFLDEALSVISRMRPPFREMAQSLEQMYPREGFVADPWLAVHHGICVNLLTGTVFSPSFTTGLLPWISRSTLPALHEMEAAFHEIGSALGTPLLAWICKTGNPGWLAHIAAEPFEKRETFAAALITSGAHKIAPPRGTRSLFATLRNLRDRRAKSDFKRRLAYSMGALKAGSHPRAIAGTLRLESKSDWTATIHPRCDDVADRAILLAWGRFRHRYEKSFPESLYYVTANLPGAAALLSKLARRRGWKRPTQMAINYLKWFGYGDADDKAERAKAWTRLEPIRAEVFEAMLNLPFKYAAKFRDIIDTALTVWTDANAATDALAVARRVCREPFSDNDVEDVFAALGTHKSGRHLLLHGPEKLLQALESRCGNHDRNTAITQGIRSFPCADSMLACTMITASTKCFMSAMWFVGMLSTSQRAALWRTFAEHPLVSLRPDISDKETVILISSVAGEKSIPAAMKAHVAGTHQLEPHRIGHYRAKLTVSRAKALLEELIQRCCAMMELKVPNSGTALAMHTIMFAHTLNGNHRVFRRWLRECRPDAENHIRFEHPKNAAWLAQKSAHQKWAQADPCSVIAVEGIGEITLRFEDDPHQLLQMGTKVRSCLGLGGICQYSAVALVTDANKRVVTAYDAEGQFLARQVVAISERSTLVCYRVYPDREDLEPAFRTFDQALSTIVGTPLQTDREYSVASLVCSEWWDDGVWMP